MMSNDSLKRKILELAFSGKLFDTKSEWNIKNIDEVFITIPVKTYQINQTEIEPNGKYPVISQSKELIEGYSNEENKLLKLYDSYVVFGDHSKTVKYIDFPFVVGADGTKVFSSIDNNVKYLYYHMLYNSFFINSSGYTRNYKYLKEFKYNIPCKSEQDMIVEKIDELFKLIDHKENNDNKMIKLKELLKEKVLDSAIHGKIIENDKELSPIDVIDIKNEIPFEIPSNWRWTTFDNISTIVRGGSPRPIKDFLTTSDDGINWIKIGDTSPNDIYINHVKEKIKPDGMKRSRFVEKGSLLLTNSMSFGRPYILNVDGCIHDGWLNIKDKNKNYYNLYMVYLLSSKYFYNVMSDKSSGAVVSNLNIDKVKSMLIPIPPLEEQKRIVEKIESLFELIEQL